MGTSSTEPEDFTPDPGASQSGLKGRARGGATWLGGRQVFNNVLRIVSVSVVARTLGPTEFGVAALAITASRFLLLFSEGGVGTYVVRFQADSPSALIAEARAAFWFNQALTVMQVAILLAGIPLAQEVFDEPSIAGPLVVLAATFLIQQASVVPEALARRDFAYKSLVIRDMTSGVGSAVLSMVLALRGFGVYSIVLPSLLIEPFRLVALLHLTGFRPGWSAGLERWRGIYRFTKHLIGSEILFLVLNDGDTLLIGALLGAQAVGIYSLAWQIAALVGRNVVSIVMDVALPTFTEALRRGDLNSVYTRTLRLLAVVTLPLQFLLAGCSSAVITVFFGPAFVDAVPVLAILAIFMGVRGVTSASGLVFSVLGTPRTGLLMGLATVPPYLAAIYLGSQAGLVEVALAVTVVRIFGGVWGLVISIDKLKGNRRVVIAAIARAVPGALAGGAIAWLLLSVFPADMRSIVQLGLAGMAGMLAAAIGEEALNRPAVREAFDFVLGR